MHLIFPLFYGIPKHDCIPARQLLLIADALAMARNGLDGSLQPPGGREMEYLMKAWTLHGVPDGDSNERRSVCDGSWF